MLADFPAKRDGWGSDAHPVVAEDDMKATLACLVVSACFSIAVVAHSQPVADEAIDEAWSAFESVWHDVRAGDATWDDMQSSYAETIGALPFERMSSQQLAGLSRMAFQFGAGMERSFDRLDVILLEDPNDLHALIRLADLLVWAGPLGYDKPVDASRERVTGLLDQVVDHPGLAGAVEDGAAALLPTLFLAYSSEQDGLAKRRRGFDTLISLIDASPSARGEVAVAIAARWGVVKDAGFGEHELAGYRDTLLPRVQGALRSAQALENPGVDALNVIGRAESAIGMLTSASATRDFVGLRAPDLTIEWSSDSSVASLSDLRGKVVVLKFWVTGCGHCIAALPTMRELAETYAGSDVVFVGVTSLQGRHHEPGAEAAVDTEGDPAAEYALMERFIASQGVTWPVVFTAESAWNPEYEVRGTPHMTLVDPDGVVVANDLHPQKGVATIRERIDGVLQDFGFEVPGGSGRAVEGE